MNDLQDWISALYQQPDMLKMGHYQRAEDLNLGLGWLYYAIGRIQRCDTAVVIGSWRGFVPLIIARALADNHQDAKVVFIDPSFVDDFWKDPKRVGEHFASFGCGIIEHHLMTTQQFVETDAYAELDNIGLLFVDGYHTEEQSRYDHEAFLSKLNDDATVVFHDSISRRDSKIYGTDKTYPYSVVDYLDTLKEKPEYQVFDVPFGGGVTLVRRVTDDQSPVTAARD